MPLVSPRKPLIRVFGAVVSIQLPIVFTLYLFCTLQKAPLCKGAHEATRLRRNSGGISPMSKGVFRARAEKRLLRIEGCGEELTLSLNSGILSHNPSVFAFGESTSLYTREATLSVTATPCHCRLRCPKKSSGCRLSSIFSTAAQSLFLAVSAAGGARKRSPLTRGGTIPQSPAVTAPFTQGGLNLTL